MEFYLNIFPKLTKEEKNYYWKLKNNGCFYHGECIYRDSNTQHKLDSLQRKMKIKYENNIN